MSEKNDTILETISSIIDRDDPTQKVLGLVANLVDSRLRQIGNENSEQHTTLFDKIGIVAKIQEEHGKRLIDIENKKTCPIGMDTKYKKLDVILFAIEHPVLTMIFGSGILLLAGDKVGEFIMQLISKL
jgi:hypothetical protein